MLSRGKLTAIVRIESPPTATDPEYGTPMGDWVVVADMQRAEWQEMLPSRGEDSVQGIDVSRRPVRVRMDYREDINAGMRIIRIDRGGLIFEIVGECAEMGNRDGIEFMAQKYSTRGDQ